MKFTKLFIFIFLAYFAVNICSVGATNGDDSITVVVIDLPTISTPTNTTPTSSTVTLGATIGVVGDPVATARGVCYGTSANPGYPTGTNGSTCVAETDAMATGAYTINISSLNANQAYNYVGYVYVDSASPIYTTAGTFTTAIQTSTQLTIPAPTLTLSKVYNRSTSAAVTPGSLVGVITGDTVTVLATATYDNANVGTGKTITVVYAIAGASASKYTKPVNYTVSTGVITAKQLTIPAPTLTLTKIYNGNTSAAVTPGSLVGVITGDTVTVSATATYDNANVGTGKTITVVYYLDGISANNYTKPVNYTVSTGVITAIGGMSGTLTPATSTCTIPLNASVCSGTTTLSWATTNPVATSGVTNNGTATPASPGGNTSSAAFTVPYLTAQSGVTSFYLYNNSVLLATSTITASCTAGTTWTAKAGGSVCKNILPVANAGPDKTITLPTTTSAPTGTSATDTAPGTISSKVWTQVGTTPSVATIGSSTTLTPTFTNLTTLGAYTFRLTATDNDGGTHYDDMTVTVNDSAPTAPTITTSSITSITQNSATGGGNVTSNGGATVSVSGITWSTSINPTYDSSSGPISGNVGQRTDGPVSGAWADDMTSLSTGTTYHIRAYAKNSVGTGYGNDITFTTSPTFTATAASSSSINLSWVAPQGTIYNYTLVRSDIVGPPIYSGTGLSYPNTSLTAGQTYTYTLNPSGSGGAYGNPTATATTISNKTDPTCSVNNSSIVYTGAQVAASISSVPASGITVTAVTYNNNGTVPTTVGAYTIKATLTPTDTTNYNTITTTCSGGFEITKANQSILTVASQSIINGGSFAALSTTGGTTGGTVTYALVAAGTAGCSVSGTTLSYTGVGTCTVKATMAGNANYNDVTSGNQTFTVGVAKTDPTCSVNNSSIVYTGAQVAASISSVPASGITVTAVTYNDNNGTVPTTVGTYTIKATLTPTDTTNYNTVTTTCSGGFEITASLAMSGTLTSSASSCTIALNESSCLVDLTWGITNPEGTPTAITASGMTNIDVTNTLTSSQSGTSNNVSVPYSGRTFYLYNNSKSLVPSSGEGITVTSSCIAGTTWNTVDKICGTLPTVAFNSPQFTNVTSTSATIGAKVTSFGIPNSISERGVCYIPFIFGTGSLGSPVLTNTNATCVKDVDTTIGSFTVDINSLSPSKKYAFRGYATNTTGTKYFGDLFFTTLAAPLVMSVSTSAGTGGSISPTSITVNYNSSTTFTIAPSTGYSIASVTGCNGSLSGTTYTTGAITSACTVTASFNKMTGSLTPTSLSSCYIPEGGNVCNIDLSWGVSYPIATPTAITNFFMTTLNVTNTLATPQSGTQSAPIPYIFSPRTFYLYNNSILLAQTTGTASCTPGTGWYYSGASSSYACRAPIIGSCGTSNGMSFYVAPTSGYCSAGSYSGISGSGPWTWSCGGSYGGSTASCSAQKAVDCVGSWNACSNGSQTYSISTAVANGGNACPYINGATRACGTTASCSATHYNCSPGTSVSNSSNLSTWTWGCNSTDGGVNASSCSETKPAPTAWITASPSSVAYNGQSTLTWGSTNATSCTATGPWSNSGALSGSGLTNTLTANTTFSIQCTGNGQTSSIASVTVGVGTLNGSCGTSNGMSFYVAPTSGYCNAGTYSGISGTGPWSWTCAGANLGTTASCSAQKAVDGGWSAWSAKDNTPGYTGTQTRTCTNPSPAYVGADCSSLDGGNSSRSYTNTPSVPTGFGAAPSLCNNNWLNLWWNASLGATNYKVYRSGTLVYDGSELAFSDGGLSLGSSYSYTITASNAGGTSGTASTSSTVSNACATTPDIKATAWGFDHSDGPMETYTGSPYTLYWNAVSNATSCKINGSTVSVSGGTQDGTASARSQSFTLSCTNSTGQSASDSITITTPPMPTGVTTSCSADSLTANVSWTAPSGYNTFYTRTSTGYNNDNVVGTSYSFPISPNINYSFWVHTKNTSNGAWSTEVYSQTINCARSHTLTVNKAGNGSGTVYGANTYPYNTVVQATETPDISSNFTGWSRDCNSSGQVTMNSNKVCTATFILKTYTLSYGANTGGSISGSTSQTINYGASGSAVTAVPSTGYIFASWSDGVTTATRTDTNITANKSVSASFNKMIGSLSASNCSITSAGSSCNTTLSWGISYPVATPTAITTSGMSDINVTNTLTTPQSGTQSVSISEGSRTFYLYNNGILLAQATATATRTTPSTPTGLTATPSSCSTTTTNAVITVSWNASSGATSYTLRDGGTTIYTGASTSYTHTGLTSDVSHSYTVLATNSGGSSAYSSAVARNAPALCTYTITASSGTGGTVTPAGVTTKNHASSQTYAITPSSTSYSIANVLVDGVSQGAISSYPFSNIIANHTISASFKLMTGSLTASNCEIALNGTACPITLTWDTTNPIGTSAVTTPTSITVATGNSNTTILTGSKTYSVDYGTRTFYLYNNGVELKNATATASCITGTSWYGGKCAPITITFSSASTDIAYNTATTLNWSVANATNCTASGGWSGAQATSGSASTGNLTSLTTFTLSCTGLNGTNGTASIIVTVGSFGTLTASNCTIGPAQNKCNTTLVWDTYNSFYTSAVTTPTNVTVLSANSSVGTSYSVDYGTRDFYLYNNGVLLATATAIASCEQFFDVTSGTCAVVPTLTSPTSSVISAKSAKVGATITSLGTPASISERGVCYSSTMQNPAREDNGNGAICGKDGNNINDGTYTIHLVKILSPSTTYYYRGYATNIAGTGYSPQGSFTTLVLPPEATIVKFKELNDKGQIKPIDYGQSITLIWDSLNAYYGCTMTSSPDTSTNIISSLDPNTTKNQITLKPLKTTVYTLICSGEGGASPSSQVQIKVGKINPTYNEF